MDPYTKGGRGTPYKTDSSTDQNSSEDNEEEIHDLVLMFANAKIPRGSDAFKAVLDEFIPEDEKDSDGVAEEKKTEETVDEVFIKETPEPKIVELPVKKRRSISFDVPRTPRTPTHVHWPDEQTKTPVASSPSAERLHHARLFMKKVPKPILKNDGECSIPFTEETR